MCRYPLNRKLTDKQIYVYVYMLHGCIFLGKYMHPCSMYMLVPKHANYQYRYEAAQYRYWYPYSNSIVFSFLSQFFQSTIEFTSLPIMVQALAKCPSWKWTPSRQCQYWYGHLTSARIENELHHGIAITGTGTWQVPVLGINSIAAVPIPVWAPVDAQ